MTVFKCWIPETRARDIVRLVADTREEAARRHALTVPLTSWALSDRGEQGVGFSLAVLTYADGDETPIVVEVELVSEFTAHPWPRSSFAATHLLRGELDKWQDDESDDDEEAP